MSEIKNKFDRMVFDTSLPNLEKWIPTASPDAIQVLGEETA